MRPLKVLFVAEAMSLAHVVRLVTLANALHEEGIAVCLATDPRYAGVIGPLRFPTLHLYSLPADRFFRAVASGGLIFDFDTLSRYACDDLALFEQTRPDVVVGDFRLSLTASARYAGIPFVNLTNAYWSPRARLRRIVPDYDWVSWFGTGLAGLLFRAFWRLGFAYHAAPVNRLRRAYGLPSLGPDFGAVLTEGDLTCFSDSPLIVPLDGLPPSQHFIGPVPWSPPVPLPPWWEAFMAMRQAGPVVYLNLGSSGSADAWQRMLEALAPLPLRVITAAPGCDGARDLRLPANARAAGIIPGDAACSAARVVVCNGGSPASYQALMHGVPVIGVAANMDQFMNMAAVEDAGCGILLRSRDLRGSVIREALARGLSDGPLQATAEKVSAAITAGSATLEFRQALHRFAGR
jgi:UDP:flavonoid glycosyltransferase YjiC (YdhE family)